MQWTNQHRDQIARLLLDNNYQRFDSNEDLKRFITKLGEYCDVNISPKDDLYDILSLAAELTGMDCIDCIKEFQTAFEAKKSSGIRI